MPHDVDIRDDSQPSLTGTLVTVALGCLLAVVAIGGSFLTLKFRELFTDFGVELPNYSIVWFRFPFLPALACLPSAALLIASLVPGESPVDRRLCRWIALFFFLLAAAAFALAMGLPLINIGTELW